MGSDLSVVNAARVSFDKASEWEFDSTGQYHSLKYDDAKLIHYLARGMSSKAREQIIQEALEAETREVLLDCFARLDVDTHWTPFAHTSISLRMQAPVPIRTQCFKHKQGLVENEESRRYISSTPKLFVPDEFRMAPTNGAKQGSGGVHPQSEMWKIPYMAQCREAIGLYESMVRSNVCPEQARFVLPQGCEVQWIWTGNLYAFANFYNKRTDAHAQKEIQDLARMVGDIIQPLFPVSWKALTE
jgi:thymidylate synthase (FAD)